MRFVQLSLPAGKGVICLNHSERRAHGDAPFSLAAIERRGTTPPAGGFLGSPLIRMNAVCCSSSLSDRVTLSKGLFEVESTQTASTFFGRQAGRNVNKLEAERLQRRQLELLQKRLKKLYGIEDKLLEIERMANQKRDPPAVLHRRICGRFRSVPHIHLLRRRFHSSFQE
jgi:hypothetical protein